MSNPTPFVPSTSRDALIDRLNVKNEMSTLIAALREDGEQTETSNWSENSPIHSPTAEEVIRAAIPSPTPSSHHTQSEYQSVEGTATPQAQANVELPTPEGEFGAQVAIPLTEGILGRTGTPAPAPGAPTGSNSTPLVPQTTGSGMSNRTLIRQPIEFPDTNDGAGNSALNNQTIAEDIEESLPQELSIEQRTSRAYIGAEEHRQSLPQHRDPEHSYAWNQWSTSDELNGTGSSARFNEARRNIENLFRNRGG